MTDFISREQVLKLLYEYDDFRLYKAAEMLPCFPAPNPHQRDGRNVMGQTEDEFWAAVERKDG